MTVAPLLPSCLPPEHLARERAGEPAPPADAARGLQDADLIVVAGVPGAGKSTAVRSVAHRSGWRILDPDTQRAWLARHLPAGTPYRVYRPLVHVLHHLLLAVTLLRGPVGLRSSGRTRLLVHEPGTRRARRAALARLATARGWRAALLLLEVSREDALAGQRARGRVVAPPAFRRHWRRWLRLRAEGPAALRAEPSWSCVAFVARAKAPSVLGALRDAPRTRVGSRRGPGTGRVAPRGQRTRPAAPARGA